MKKSRSGDEQMVTILLEADKAPPAEVAKKPGIGEQAIYNWRQHFCGRAATDVKRLKLLEQETARLKKMLAERDLELDVMKEMNAKNVWPVAAPPPHSTVTDFARFLGLSISAPRKHAA